MFNNGIINLISHLFFVWPNGYFFKVKVLFIGFKEVPSPIKEVVGCACANSIFKHLWVQRRDLTIIKLVPLLSKRILTKCSVVTKAHVAVVV